jgi:hypothetical protein
MALGSVVANRLRSQVDKLFYKDYTITPIAIHDESTGKYAPTVQIEWRGADGKDRSYSFTLRERCATFNDGHSHCIRAGENVG